jgi:hypothetical protein
MLAHVPYLERGDYSASAPFRIEELEKSIAIYAWLDGGGDIDFAVFQLTDPKELFVEVIVPVCPEYAESRPSYAVLGPGLPPPAEPLPIPLPPGYGAIVVPNLPPGMPRDQFYEPFGGKSYYSGVPITKTISGPGTWAVIVWDPYKMGGDYVLTVGRKEIWKAEDVLRALIVTPLIRQDKELHSSCVPSRPVNAAALLEDPARSAPCVAEQKVKRMEK